MQLQAQGHSLPACNTQFNCPKYRVIDYCKSQKGTLNTEYKSLILSLGFCRPPGWYKHPSLGNFSKFGNEKLSLSFFLFVFVWASQGRLHNAVSYPHHYPDSLIATGASREVSKGKLIECGLKALQGGVYEMLLHSSHQTTVDPMISNDTCIISPQTSVKSQALYNYWVLWFCQ